MAHSIQISSDEIGKMAHSFQTSSDEIELVCDICLEDNKHIQAVGLCSVCDQYLCGTCKTVHERSKASRGHAIIPSDKFADINKPQSKKKVLCQTHGNEEVLYFCESHKIPICGKCRLIDHRDCEVVNFDIVVRKESPRSKIKDTKKQSNGLLNEILNVKSVSEQYLKDFELEKEAALAELRDQRLEIENMLSKWTKASENHVNKVFEKEAQNLKDNINTCSLLAPTIEATANDMNNVATKSDEEVFILLQKAKQETEKYSTTLRELFKKAYKSELQTEKQDVTEVIQNQLDKAFNCSVKRYRNRTTPFTFNTRPYNEREAFDIGVIDILSKTDSQTPGVTGIELVENGQLLMGDMVNKKLKLFDAQNTQIHELSLAMQPWRMCATSCRNEVIVSFPKNGYLQKATISPECEILMGQEMKVSHPSVLLARYHDDYITEGSSNNNWYFCVTDKRGKKVRDIKIEPVGSGLFQNVTHMATSPDSKVLYVCDNKMGCVALSMKGEVLFKFTDTRMKDYGGITTDTEGNIYLSGTESNNIMMISDQGESIKMLVEGIERPRYMKYEKTKNTLFVSKLNTSIVQMYHLL